VGAGAVAVTTRVVVWLPPTSRFAGCMSKGCSALEMSGMRASISFSLLATRRGSKRLRWGRNVGVAEFKIWLFHIFAAQQRAFSGQQREEGWLRNIGACSLRTRGSEHPLSANIGVHIDMKGMFLF